MRCVVVMYLFIGTVGGEEVGGSFLNCWCILLPAHTQYTLVTWSIQAVYKSIYKHFRFRLMNTMFLDFMCGILLPMEMLYFSF